MNVLRWGQSAYETDADLDLEQAAAEKHGWQFARHANVKRKPKLAKADVLVVTSKVKVTAEVLEKLGSGTVITTTSGSDHIDLKAAKKLGIAVARCPMARRDAVVEHAVGALIGLGKRWPAQHKAAKEGEWIRDQLPKLAPMRLAGSTVLIVGLGVVGTRMAQVLNALDVNVLGVDPKGVPDGVEQVHLEPALARCDAVTLHCSLTQSSTGLLDRRRLSMLQSHAILVNTARGRLMDVECAIDSLRTGLLGGIAVDVFPSEPYVSLGSGARVEGVWLTPHASGYSPDLGTRLSAEVGAAFDALAAGEPLPHSVSA